MHLPSIHDLNLANGSNNNIIHISHILNNLDIPYIEQLHLVKRSIAKNANIIKHNINLQLANNADISTFNIIYAMYISMHNQGIFIEYDYLLKVLC